MQLGYFTMPLHPPGSDLTKTMDEDIEQLVTIPVEIAEKLVKLPTELIQLKIDTTNKQKAALDARKGLIESEKGFLDALRAAKASGVDTGDGDFD